MVMSVSRIARLFEDLVAHHRLLLKGLEGGPGADISAPMVRVIEQEIAIINAGLERLAT
jgi:hypothetical protein